MAQFKFKVLRGKLNDGFNKDGTLRVYKPGVTVETDKDLSKLDPTGQE